MTTEQYAFLDQMEDLLVGKKNEFEREVERLIGETFDDLLETIARQKTALEREADGEESDGDRDGDYPSVLPSSNELQQRIAASLLSQQIGSQLRGETSAPAEQIAQQPVMPQSPPPQQYQTQPYFPPAGYVQQASPYGIPSGQVYAPTPPPVANYANLSGYLTEAAPVENSDEYGQTLAELYTTGPIAHSTYAVPANLVQAEAPEAFDDELPEWATPLQIEEAPVVEIAPAISLDNLIKSQVAVAAAPLNLAEQIKEQVEGSNESPKTEFDLFASIKEQVEDSTVSLSEQIKVQVEAAPAVPNLTEQISKQLTGSETNLAAPEHEAPVVEAPARPLSLVIAELRAGVNTDVDSGTLNETEAIIEQVATLPEAEQADLSKQILTTLVSNEIKKQLS